MPSPLIPENGPSHPPVATRRSWLSAVGFALGAAAVCGAGSPVFAAESPQGKKAKKAAGPQTPPPTKPPLEPVDITRLPPGLERLDLFLLLGQSNMKGRGFMPEEPKRDPQIVMMHLMDDTWYLARHPLHLTGDAKTFRGADNAGVGPGLAFAEAVAARSPKARLGLIPCAVGGTPISVWQRGTRRYDDALRRAKLALERTASVPGRIGGVLWLQGEADATDERLPVYEAKLLTLVDNLRADLALPELPFIAATIGEMSTPERNVGKAAMNQLLLSLPTKRKKTACVDARDLKSNIGDGVHFDTAAQNEIGLRYAQKYFELVGS